MDVSVIISVFSIDRLKEVLDCIKSLGVQSFPPKEILVVLDPIDDLVKFYKSKLPHNVKLVISPKRGLSNARNEGIKHSESKIIAFIDDDAVAEKDWLKSLVKNYDDPSVVSVGGLIKPIWEGKQPSWFPEEIFWVVGCSYKGLPQKKDFVRNAIGCNMSFRRYIFDEVGYFRTDFGRFGKHLLGSEEPELSSRILKKLPKSKIIYDPEAVVYHNVSAFRKKPKYIWRRSFYEGLSKALLMSNKKKSENNLSTENEFVSYLLLNSITSRLKKFYSLRNLSQLLVLLISSFEVFLGFIMGKIMRY